LPRARQRSNLPVAREATGRTIPHRTNREMFEILEQEDFVAAVHDTQDAKICE
jgi:hypothetical protein